MFYFQQKKITGQTKLLSLPKHVFILLSLTFKLTYITSWNIFKNKKGKTVHVILEIILESKLFPELGTNIQIVLVYLKLHFLIN